jgi:ABC-2 type transport system ATP-binding protein
VIALGSPSELIARLGGEHLIEFVLNDGSNINQEAFHALPGVVGIQRDEDAYLLTVTATHLTLPALLEKMRAEGRELTRLTTRHASLEDLFVNLTGRHLRDDAA